jgi:hypothetical protein
LLGLIVVGCHTGGGAEWFSYREEQRASRALAIPRG